MLADVHSYSYDDSVEDDSVFTDSFKVFCISFHIVHHKVESVCHYDKNFFGSLHKDSSKLVVFDFHVSDTYKAKLKIYFDNCFSIPEF